MSERRPLTLLVLAAALAGCAASRPLVAGVGDAAAYRETRVAPSIDARVEAASSYLVGRPRGAYRGEVEAWLDEVEPTYFVARRDSEAGLRAYLRALPHGPHADEAQARLDALAGRRQGSTRDALGRSAAAIEARLEGEAAARREVVEALAGWTGRVAHADLWSATDARPGLGALGLACDAAACRALVELAYVVPGDEGREPRVAHLAIEARLAGDALEVAEVSGPDLFDRVYEAQRARATTASDRPAAVAAAVELLAGALEARWPAARCARVAEAPVALGRSCDGLSVEVVAAPRRGEDDRVVVRRAPP